MKLLYLACLAVMLMLNDACTTHTPIGTGPCDANGPVVVYKTRNDYSNNISVQLAGDKKTITAYPGTFDAPSQKPVALANGYYLQKMVGNAFTSVTFDQYLDTNNHYTVADLASHVIDTDPFTEVYNCCILTRPDTGYLDNLIRSNQLTKCTNSK
jgi:hypothetical protein